MYDAHLARIHKRPGNYAQILLHKKLIDKFLKHENLNLPNEEISVVEVGCGSGRIALEFLNRGYRYSAIEPTDSMRHATFALLANAGIHRSSFEIFQQRLPSTPKKLEKKVDFVVMIHVLEHAKSGYEAREWLESVNKILKPGGLLLIVSPDSVDYKWNFYDCDWSHAFPTTRSNVTELLLDVDFKILKASEIRSWISNPIGKFFLGIIREIFPFKTINLIGKILLKQELLGTGFGVGFLFKNIFIVAQSRS
jgi:SAM-dependent methyltransferase